MQTVGEMPSTILTRESFKRNPIHTLAVIAMLSGCSQRILLLNPGPVADLGTSPSPGPSPSPVPEDSRAPKRPRREAPTGGPVFLYMAAGEALLRSFRGAAAASVATVRGAGAASAAVAQGSTSAAFSEAAAQGSATGSADALVRGSSTASRAAIRGPQHGGSGSPRVMDWVLSLEQGEGGANIFSLKLVGSRVQLRDRRGRPERAPIDIAAEV